MASDLKSPESKPVELKPIELKPIEKVSETLEVELKELIIISKTTLIIEKLFKKNNDLELNKYQQFYITYHNYNLMEKLAQYIIKMPTQNPFSEENLKIVDTFCLSPIPEEAQIIYYNDKDYHKIVKAFADYFEKNIENCKKLLELFR